MLSESEDAVSQQPQGHKKSKKGNPVILEGTTIGEDCNITIVSTQGESVIVKKNSIKNRTHYSQGQMSESTVQMIKKAQVASPEGTTLERQGAQGVVECPKNQSEVIVPKFLGQGYALTTL